jgi:hypothetical protein
MAKTLPHAIRAALSKGPLAISELYEVLERDSYKRPGLKAALSRLIDEGAVTRSKLGFNGHDALVSLGPLEGGAPLVLKLVTKAFYGRKLLMNLFNSLRTEHPAVTRADVAKIMALELGHGDEPDWEQTERLIGGLADVGLLREGDGEYWVADKDVLGAAKLGFSSENVQISQVRLRDNLRYTLAEALVEWLRRNSFVSWGGNKVCGPDTPIVNAYGLGFDFLGFDFFSEGSKSKQRALPVIGDVLRGSCNLSYARSFVERAGRVEGRAGRPRAFVFAASFSLDALNHLKQNRVYPWTHNQLLGDETARAVKEAVALLENLGQEKDVDPARFREILGSLENFRSIFGNMKGQLFEVMMGYVFQRRGYATWLGWRIGGQKLDVDVRGYKNTSAIIVECKAIGANKFVDPGEVRKHFTNRAPRAHKLLRQSLTETITDVEGIVITTGSFDPVTVADLNAGVFGRKADLRFSLWDRQRLIEELRKEGHTVLIETVEQFYGDEADDAAGAQEAIPS